MAALEGEQHMILVAQPIQASGANNNLSDDFREILLKLDSHLATMSLVTESTRGVFKEVEAQLSCAERKIMQCESSPCAIWDSDGEASEYFQAVHEVQAMTHSLQVPSAKENGMLKELSHRAQCILLIAMSRLQEELCHMLVQNKQFSDSQYLSFHTCPEELASDESFLEDVPEESEIPRRDGSMVYMECVSSVVDPEVLLKIKSIASVMFASDYGHEFCETFTRIRKDALIEYFTAMEVEILSVEDVLRLEWESLDSKVKKWIWTLTNFIRVYLTSEKQFGDRILGGLGDVGFRCFVEIAEALMFHLLNFGEAVAMGPHRPEKLCCLLNMYEVLADLQPDIDSLFLEESGSFVRSEFYELMTHLGGSVRATFSQFKNAIASDASMQAVPGGAIHPLTKYVMNYLRLLTAYGSTLGSLLENLDVPILNAAADIDRGQECSYPISCSVACHLLSIASTLEMKLVGKSNLYNDSSAEHIFLMNNIHYMVQKVKGSELRPFFGDDWIRKHNGKFQQHARSYWRVTWSTVVSLLRDDGKTNRRERCRRFTVAFDEVYKSQMQWYIPNPELREDQQISASQKVIHAYQSFVGRHSDDKFLKYSVEDLEKLFLDLFVEPPKSLHASRRR